MSENFEKFPTSKLQERYGTARSAIYSRLNALRIKPARQDKGNKTYITNDQLQLMDDLNAHMKDGGKIEEFVQQCITDGRIVVLEKPAVEPTTETAIVRQTETQMTASQHQVEAQATTFETEISPEANIQDKIENLQVQKRKRVRLKDIQEVNEHAQRRAFSKAVTEETLTMFYEATEEFTIPGLKEQLEQHRAACRQARVKGMAAYDVNDFLSEAFQIIGINF